MRIRNPGMRRLYECLSQLSALHKGHPHLMANEILAKNIFYFDMGERFLDGVSTAAPSFGDILSRIGRSVRANLGQLRHFLALRRLHRLSGQRGDIGKKEDFLVFTEFNPQTVCAEDRFHDRLFKGLDAFLKTKNAGRVNATLVFDPPEPRVHTRAFEIVDRDREAVLTQYQLCGPGWFFSLLWFILAYPFRVLALGLRVSSQGGLFREVGNLLLFSLDQPVVSNYIYYLYGRSLARLVNEPRTMLLWYENRALERCFIRGLRHNRLVRIHGAQLLVVPDNMISLHADAREVPFGLVPDAIFVNGPYFLRNDLPVEFRPGPALRYSYLESVDRSPAPGRCILVLVSYFHGPGLELLRLLPELEVPSDTQVLIKMHPGKYWQTPDDIVLPANFTFTQSDLVDLLPQARVVIGSATGALVEAAAWGAPVLVHRGTSTLEFDYLPDLGRGVIWKEGRDARELNAGLRAFWDEPREAFAGTAAEFRRLLFTPVDEAAFCALTGLELDPGRLRQ